MRKYQHSKIPCSEKEARWQQKFLTWDIDYFLVHIQEGVLCFFTSLTQCINLQRDQKKKKNRLIVSWGSSPKHGAHSFSRRGPDCIQSLSVLTMRRYVARNQSCFDSGCVGVSFPRSRLSCSADDGRRSFVACPCTSPSPPPRWSLLQCVQVCVSALCSGRPVGWCVFVFSPPARTHTDALRPSSALTSLNSWLSLSSRSGGRLFSRLLAAIRRRRSITDAAINTRGRRIAFRQPAILKWTRH